MSLASGLARQIGYAKEAAPETVTTPTVFVPLVDESLKLDTDRVESAGIIAGRRVLTSAQWNGGNMTPGGDVQHELYTLGQEDLFTAMFGTVAKSGSGTFTRVYTPGDLSDDTMIVQVGEVTTGGVVVPFTWSGCSVASWEIGCQQGAIGTLGVHALVMLIIQTAYRGVVASDSLRAMTIRIVVWLIILTLMFVGSRRQRPAQA